MAPRTLAENTAAYPVRDAAAAEAAAAPISTWVGWCTLAWANAYFGPEIDRTGVTEGVSVQASWGDISDPEKRAAIRQASFRLACCNWGQVEGRSDDFPWWSPDDAPDEILSATAEMALFYVQNPERRFQVVGAESERDVAGNQFGFKYSWARNFYGDLPPTVMGMIQRFIQAPENRRAKPQPMPSTTRVQRFAGLPGWGMRYTGGP